MKHESCTLLLSSSCRVWSGIRKSESIEAIYSEARTVVSVCHPINSGYRPFTFYTNPHFSKHWHLKCILFGAMPLFVEPKNYRNGHARRDKMPLKRGRNHIVKSNVQKQLGNIFCINFQRQKNMLKVFGSHYLRAVWASSLIPRFPQFSPEYLNLWDRKEVFERTKRTSNYAIQ